MSIFTATSFWNVQPVVIAPALTPVIRTDPFSASVYLAIPGSTFSELGATTYYSDISAAVRGTGTNVRLIPTGSGTGAARGILYPSASLVSSGSGYNWAANGYTGSIFSSGSQNVGYFTGSVLPFGSSNFVIEYWTQFKGAFSAPPFNKGGLNSQGGVLNQIFDYNGQGNRFRIYYNDGGTFTSWPLVQNNWYHVAYVRNGTTIRVYVNGQQTPTTATVSGTMTLPPFWSIMGVNTGNANEGAPSLVQDFRVSIGTTRNYTSSFTPPQSIVTLA
jgi:hypothetical protein